MSNPTTLEMMPLTQLLSMQHRKNPKRHDLGEIIGSITRNGFKQTPMIDRATGVMVAGHGRCLALERMRFDGSVVPDGIGINERGEWTVPTLFSTFKSETDRDAYVIADNRLTELGGYDDRSLADMLSQIAESDAGLVGTGYDGDDLDELLGALNGPEPEPESTGKEVEVEGHIRLIGHQVRPPVQMTNDDWTLHLGDCLEGLRRLEDNSVDAVVTDPPAGISFMGREWDDDKGGRDKWIEWLCTVMTECIRVLKPGGHVLAWALPRTSHWTAKAVEDAGFEIRDVVYHAFGTGFPKSLDVSKAIDAKLGVERPIVGTQNTFNKLPLSDLNKQGGNGIGNKLHTTMTGVLRSSEPATEQAAQWSGWGTALKPAIEPWIMGRKPLDGTVAECVMKHGTGGINIAATRVGDEARHNPSASSMYSLGDEPMEDAGGTDAIGRWPAHLVISHSAACVPIGMVEDSHTVRVGEKLGDDSRELEFGMGEQATETVTQQRIKYRCVLGCPIRMLDEQSGAQDDGMGASRFYYVAKPSKAETEAGLDALPERSAGELTDREEGSDGLNSPRAGAGRSGGRRNIHPTKKSIALMRWLVRLVAPPGALVLDCFAGSGTTGLAALVEGCRFVGFEMSPEYHAIASERLRSIIEDPRQADAIETELDVQSSSES